MSATGTLAEKRKLASLTLLQLSSGVGEASEAVYQIVVSPSSAEYPKRTVTIGQGDISLFCAEMAALLALIEALERKGQG